MTVTQMSRADAQDFIRRNHLRRTLPERGCTISLAYVNYFSQWGDDRNDGLYLSNIAGRYTLTDRREEVSEAKAIKAKTEGDKARRIKRLEKRADLLVQILSDHGGELGIDVLGNLAETVADVLVEAFDAYALNAYNRGDYSLMNASAEKAGQLDQFRKVFAV